MDAFEAAFSMDSTMPLTWNKKPYIALSLSLAMPGLGQIYLGQGELGLLLYLVPNLTVVLAFLFSNAEGALLSLVFLSLVYFGSCLKAYYDAKFTRYAAEPKAYNHPMIYLFLFVLHLAFTVWLTNPNSYLGRNVVIRSFRAGTQNMEPVIRENDLILTFRRPDQPLELENGQIVVARSPHDGHYEIRRVVALAGDRIQLYKGRIYCNGIALRQDLQPPGKDPNLRLYREQNHQVSYLVSYPRDSEPKRGGIWTLPKGQCLTLTDRRDQREDLQPWGPISEDKIIGRAAFLLWPRGGLSRFGPIRHGETQQER